MTISFMVTSVWHSGTTVSVAALLCLKGEVPEGTWSGPWWSVEKRESPLRAQATVCKLWGLGPCRDTPRPARAPGPSALPFLGKPFSRVQPPRGQFPSWVVLAGQQDPVWGPGCSVHGDSRGKYDFQPQLPKRKGRLRPVTAC